MNDKKKLGIGLIIAPFALLFFTFLIQILGRFVLSFDFGSSAHRIINIISLLLGIITFVGFIPLVVIGIVLLASPDKTPTDSPDIKHQ